MSAPTIMEVVWQVLLRVYPDILVWVLLFLVSLLVLMVLNRLPASVIIHFLFIISFTVVAAHEDAGLFDLLKAGMYVLGGVMLVIGVFKFFRR